MPQAVQDLLRHAEARLREHRFAEAAGLFSQALSRDPNYPDAWYNLGWVRRRLGNPEASLKAYYRAIEQGMSSPEVAHLNRAVIYADDLLRADLARAELEQALALNGQYLPALLNLANLEESYGQRSEAIGIYERILRIEPQSWEALARRANCSFFSDCKDPLIDKLRAAARRSDVAVSDRAHLGFALGRALDACGAYEEAFAAYAAANEASRASAGPNFRAYDQAAQSRFIDQLIHIFDRPAREDHPTATGPTPIFICGMFRSGSTLIEQVLAGHPQVTAGGEIPFFPRLLEQDLAPFPAAMNTMSRSALDELARRYLRHLATLFPDAVMITDKRPDNFVALGLIKQLLPDAKIIHTTRNPLDNCLSVYFLHLDQAKSYALDLADAGHFCTEERRLMAHWKTLYPDTIHTVDYDAFVRNPVRELAPLLEFCGLDWRDECLAITERRGAVKTASAWQVRQPLYQHASGRWRHYESHLGELRESLAHLPHMQA